MNRIPGSIKNIQVSGRLSIVQVQAGEILLSAIVIDTPETAEWLRKDKDVELVFKETEVIIGVGVNHSVSLQNRIEGTISNIQESALLSKVMIETAVGTICSVLSTSGVHFLKLMQGMHVTAMIKTNEIMISP